MKSNARVPQYAAEERLVYDPHADEITRPDIVPAALRFAEDSQPSSGFEHRKPALAQHSHWRETRDALDEATVADVPFLRSPRVPSDGRPSPAPDVPRSGTQHRQVSAKPPSSAPQRAVESTLEPASRRGQRGRWLVPLLVLLTTAASAVLGMSLADGSLKQVAERLVDSLSEGQEGSPMPSSATSAPPRALMPPPRALMPPSRTLTPSPRPAPSTEVREAPVVRFEDLPLSKQSKRVTKTRRAGGGARRRTP